MAKYVIGLDGGGTKTELALVDMSGELLYTGVTGALNPTSRRVRLKQRMSLKE